MITSTEVQLGKNGITEGFIETLKNRFERYQNVRVSILKSAGHEKAKVREYSDEILDKLGKNYTSKIIGFKIIVKKWRKAKR